MSKKSKRISAADAQHTVRTSCALCQLEKPLIESHIVPEFMYQKLYDTEHRFMKLSTIASGRVRHARKGLREHLLCLDCDQQFGRYEDYAAKVFYGDADFTVRQYGEHFSVEDLEYRRLKLFFVSLLWRFGVTTIEDLRGADLGPKHTETLRKMLKAEDPGDYLSYPCLVTAVTWNKKHVADLIVPPCLDKMEAHAVWRVVVAGHLLRFFVSSHPPPSSFHEGFLQEGGSLMITVHEITEITFLSQLARELRDANKGKKHKLATVTD